ncbi:hypothetical protein L596_011070 [Steinernema carpocapsae]|uniref:Ig-like domain-containing protein n=1 Tax=Steinernema carpocapsae TaxID=34508 RepID=A0A4U5NTL6_STECR|nr:hypothetical protein L596_011070 [Steinernema carpocapsae]
MADAEIRFGGWYRCINPANKINDLANLYFVDVSTELKIFQKYVKNAIEADAHRNKFKTRTFTNYDLETFWKLTEETECDRCGGIGEMRREYTCYLKVINGTSEDRLKGSTVASWMLLFNEVPCASSLVPYKLRKIVHRDLRYHINEIIFPCQRKCLDYTPKTRKIQGLDDKGHVVNVDELAPGEFALDERLPPLPRKVVRRSISKKTKHPLRLDCGGGTVYWKKDGSNITTKAVYDSYRMKDVYIRARGELYIKRFSEQDEGHYFCYQTDGDYLLRTFRVKKIPDENTKSAAVTLRMLIKAFLGVVIFVAVFSLICDLKLKAQRFEFDHARRVFYRRNRRKLKVTHV